MQQVSHHCVLDAAVDLRVGRERRIRVDLNEPRFERRVEHDVKSPHLKAVVAVRDLELDVRVDMRLNGQHGMRDNVVHLAPHMLPRHAAFGLNVRPQRIQRPFGCRIAVGVDDLVRIHVRQLLAHRIVGQVHASLLQVGLAIGVLADRKARQAVVVHIQPQWVEARCRDVDAQVELALVDGVGVVDVVLHQYVLGVARHLARLRHHADAAPAAAVGGLADVEARWVALRIADELVVVSRQHEVARYKVKCVSLGAPHVVHVAVQLALDTQLAGAREVVCPLEFVHFGVLLS
mmetsp:Transcript_38863/g.115626  ORF Transcript_38863/g.115626 Transcript_38863/m.115626 type:complete len:291 (+) Transcript_38863:1678-2550(+)